MNTTLLRMLAPVAGLLLVSCAGMNPWASNPPRREKPSTDPHYNQPEGPTNPYLQPADSHQASSGTTKENAANNGGTPTTGADSQTPPPPPTKKDKDNPDATATTKTTAPPTPPAPAPATGGSLPYGKPVPGKSGFVYSPYDQSAGMIDVKDIPPGTKVRDPYTGKIFLVP